MRRHHTGINRFVSRLLLIQSACKTFYRCKWSYRFFTAPVLICTVVNIFLGYIAPMAPVIPLAVLAAYSHKMPRPLKMLVWYLALALLAGNISSEMARNGINNLWVIHIYTVAELLLLLLFFGFLMPDPLSLKVFLGVGVVFPLYCAVNAVFLQSPFIFNTYTRPLGAAICIILCVVYWWRSPVQEARRWGNVPENWIVAGIFIYFSSAFFVFLFSNYLQQWVQQTQRRQVFTIIWYSHAALFIVMNLMFAIGLLKCSQPAKISSSSF